MLCTFPSMILVAVGDNDACGPEDNDGLLLVGSLLPKLGRVGAAGIARPRSLIAWYTDSGCKWTGRSCRRPATSVIQKDTQNTFILTQIKINIQLLNKVPLD